jgi:triacylglycerol esterase/lipase EstA (alpha/beta hydrolase family)
MKIIIATLNHKQLDKISEVLKQRFKDLEIEHFENYEDVLNIFDEKASIIFIDNELLINGLKAHVLSLFTRKYKTYIKSRKNIFFFISIDKNVFTGFGHFDSNVSKIHWGKSIENNLSKIKIELDKQTKESPLLRQKLINRKKIFFVHGFTGNKDTWKKLNELISIDPDFIGLYEIDYYNYPTFTFSPLKLLKLFISNKYDNLFDNAKSLNTKILNDNSNKIIIVGHSLGGLIIREFLISFYSDHKKKLDKIILFAPAHNGSNWATFLKIIYRKNIHLKILSKNNWYLNDLNSRWLNSRIENKIYFKAIIGLRDKTVKKDNAIYGIQAKNIEYINNKDHLDIKNPKDVNSSIYKSFKRHILN